MYTLRHTLLCDLRHVRKFGPLRKTFICHSQSLHHVRSVRKLVVKENDGPLEAATTDIKTIFRLPFPGYDIARLHKFGCLPRTQREEAPPTPWYQPTKLQGVVILAATCFLFLSLLIALWLRINVRAVRTSTIR